MKEFFEPQVEAIIGINFRKEEKTETIAIFEKNALVSSLSGTESYDNQIHLRIDIQDSKTPSSASWYYGTDRSIGSGTVAGYLLSIELQKENKPLMNLVVASLQKFGFNSLLTNYLTHRNFSSDTRPSISRAQQILKNLCNDITYNLELLDGQQVKEIRNENGRREKSKDYSPDLEPLSPNQTMRMHKKANARHSYRRNKRKIGAVVAVVCIIAIGFILLTSGLLNNLEQILASLPFLSSLSSLSSYVPILVSTPNASQSEPTPSGDVSMTVNPPPQYTKNHNELSQQANIKSENSPQQTTTEPSKQTVQPNIDELRNYALQLINEDRSAKGLSPVELSNNQAAQIHAQDVFQTRQISHWMTNGEKPYMTYTRLGGLGNVGQNVAIYLCDGFGCSIDPMERIQSSEHDMIYNDASSNWGHRDNILDKNHTHVSIGIAHDDHTFVMVQNFEDNYIDYISPIAEINGIVSFSGNLKTDSIQGIGIYYDPIPTPELYQEHKTDGFYKMGDQLATVEQPPQGNEFYPPSSNTFEIADIWIQQGNRVNIAFDISPFVTNAGVYTIVAYLKDNGDSFPVTSYSITKTSPMVQQGFKSSKVYYACTQDQLNQYNQLQQQYDTLLQQYNGLPKTATSDQEYQHDTQLYNQLNSMENQLKNFRC